MTYDNVAKAFELSDRLQQGEPGGLVMVWFAAN